MSGQIQTPNGKPIYDIALDEMHRVTVDESARRTAESKWNEARGREAARLHVQVTALTAADERQEARSRETVNQINQLMAELRDRTTQLQHLIESFENVADKRFASESDQIRTFETTHNQRLDATQALLNERVQATQAIINERSQATHAQITEFKTSVHGAFEDLHHSILSRTDTSRESLAQDVRSLREEVIRLVDSRMNQADAAFAAVRGDVEVVKFLVMDLIKDRLGRTDPKSKPF
ncbi:MAG: hypothetical protein ACYDDF_11125 [Thermoplasmatota archaeon]